VPNRVGCVEGLPPPQKFFLFCDLEIEHILVNYEVLNLNYVIILGEKRIFQLTSPNQNIGECVPGISGRVDASALVRV